MTLSGYQLIQYAQQGVLPLTLLQDSVDFVLGLSPFELSGLLLAGTFLLGGILLGLLPSYSSKTIETARQSPVISVFVGIPATLVLVMFLYLAVVISESSIGIFFAIPLVTVTLGLLPAWTVLGVVTTGTFLGARVGRDTVTVGLLAGVLLVGALAFVVEVLVVVGALVSCLGVGAGTRVLVSGGTTTDPEQRKVPPANKI